MAEAGGPMGSHSHGMVANSVEMSCCTKFLNNIVVQIPKHQVNAKVLIAISPLDLKRGILVHPIISCQGEHDHGVNCGNSSIGNLKLNTLCGDCIRHQAHQKTKYFLNAIAGNAVDDGYFEGLENCGHLHLALFCFCGG